MDRRAYDDPMSTIRGLASGRPVRWQRNPGNAGDALIAAATVQQFNSAGIAWEPAAGGISPSDVVVFGGGGSFVPYYPQAARFVSQVHDKVASFVLLPHSVRGYEKLLGELGDNCHLFLRDQVSFEHVRRLNTRAHLYLAPDVAIRMDVCAVLRAGCGIERLAATPQGWLAKRDILFKTLSRLSRKVLINLRTDGERNPSTPRLPGLDLSMELMAGTDVTTVENAEAVTAAYLLAVDYFECIVTDRLHGAIAAGLMGKRCLLLDNSYGKCSGVWECGLSEAFPTVEMARHVPEERLIASRSYSVRYG